VSLKFGAFIVVHIGIREGCDKPVKKKCVCLQVTLERGDIYDATKQLMYLLPIFAPP
jgi:hypothetical protein